MPNPLKEFNPYSPLSFTHFKQTASTTACGINLHLEPTAPWSVMDDSVTCTDCSTTRNRVQAWTPAPESLTP